MDNKKKKKAQQNFNQEVEILKKELEECKSKYIRALADYQNLEKRAWEEREETVKNATRNVIVRLLPFLDNLEKAEIFIKDQGLKMIKEQFLQMLKEEGVEEIDLVGKEFDPNLAEAVDIIASDKDNIIIEVLTKGYLLNGKLLRHAQVKVSKES